VDDIGRIAYQAWRDAQMKTGENTKPWEELLQDDQGCWREVAQAILRLANDRHDTTGESFTPGH